VVSIEFSLSAVLALVLIILDKTGKLTVPVLLVLLILAAALAIHPAIANRWVTNAPSAGRRYWRASAAVILVLLGFGALGLWIFPSTQHLVVSEAAKVKSETVKDERQQKQPAQGAEIPIQSSKSNAEPKGQAKRHTEAVTGPIDIRQQSSGPNSPNIAQVGNNNQATINPQPPERNWVITEDICKKLLRPIRSTGSIQVSIGAFVSDPDGANVVNQLARCLPSVPGWSVTMAVLPPVPEAVTVVTSAENESIARTLQDGLQSIGFRPKTVNGEAQKAGSPPSQDMPKTETHPARPRESGPTIQQQGQTNIAQIGNNNQANIGVVPPQPRELKPEEFNELVAVLSARPATRTKILILSIQGDMEAFKFATQLSEALRAANWELYQPVSQYQSFGPLEFGMQVRWRGTQPEPNQRVRLDPNTPWGLLSLELMRLRPDNFSVLPGPSATDEGVIMLFVNTNPKAKLP
jgi:hypothetical protein